MAVFLYLFQLLRWALEGRGADRGFHKVRIYKEYHSVCHLVGIGTLPPHLSPASVPLPPEPGGGGHSPAGEGLGESQFQRLGKKLSTLPTLWRFCTFVSMPSNFFSRSYFIYVIFASFSLNAVNIHTPDNGDGGHKQLISNGGRYKPAFAERDKKQIMIDLRGISSN